MSVTEDPFAKAMENRARFEVTPWEDDASKSPSDMNGSSRSQPMRPGKSRSPGPSFIDNHGPLIKTTTFGGYLHEPAEERSPRSPSFPTMLGRHDTWNVDFAGTDRRPSVASTMTMSSTGSGRIGGRGAMHKKLQGFFGDEPPLRENRYGSDASTTSMDRRPGMGSRAQSIRDGFSSNGQATPDYGAQPRSPQLPPQPQPSSEVTPWDFQDPQVSSSSDSGPVVPSH
jgi:adenylate cyclase